ncbi:hypothetical protein KW882_00570 [Vibrio parahaemolyticus]
MKMYIFPVTDRILPMSSFEMIGVNVMFLSMCFSVVSSLNVFINGDTSLLEISKISMVCSLLATVILMFLIQRKSPRPNIEKWTNYPVWCPSVKVAMFMSVNFFITLLAV